MKISIASPTEARRYPAAARRVRSSLLFSTTGSALGALFLFAAFPLPAQTGTINDVQHVVIFMQENRSFDEYFGSLKGVRGFSDRNALVFQNGNTDLYQPSGGGYVLPFHTTAQCLNDVAHDWGSGHAAWNLGK